MSLALDLMPNMGRELNSWFLGCIRLMPENDGWANCVRDNCRREPLPDTCEFEYYHDGGSCHTTVDAQGKTITYATAGDLVAVPLVTPDDDEPVTLLPRTKATIAYLKALPPEWPVALYFH